MSKSFKLIVIIFILFNVVSKSWSLSLKEEFFIKRVFNQLISQINKMPITLFPGKTQKQLVLLRRGFKKYYFQKPFLGRIEELPSGVVRVYLARLFIKYFPLKNGYFELKGVKIDFEKQILFWKNLSFFFWVDLKEVSKYVYTQCIRNNISWPYFVLKGKRIAVDGKLRTINMNFKVKGEGEFKLSPNNEIYFEVYWVKFGYLPVPSFGISMLMKKFNPVVKLENLPLNLKAKQFLYGKNLIGIKFDTQMKKFRLKVPKEKD